MKPHALFTDSESRGNYLRALGTDRFVPRGGTFAHFAAIHIAVWADMQEVYEDAGRLLANELPFALVSPPPSFVYPSLRWSPTLQMEVRKALAPIQWDIEHDINTVGAARKGLSKRPHYVIPARDKLSTLYDTIIGEALDLAAQDLKDKLVELREYRSECYHRSIEA